MLIETSDRTRELCAFLTALEFDTIPTSVIERAKDLALDHFGVALHSADLPWTRIVREYRHRVPLGHASVSEQMNVLLVLLMIVMANV